MTSFKKHNIINSFDYNEKFSTWNSIKPFPHIVIDNFFKSDIADELEKEFPNFDDDIWHIYQNKIEVKKTCNNWNVFPNITYNVFNFLNSSEFTTELSRMFHKGKPLFSDNGLNGGGWHIHSKGGKLNTHLDYSLHPKLKLQRKLNIIIYLNSNWEESWGGSLGFWDNKSSEEPGELIKEVVPKFNRAVIFDTTFNSWHGLPQEINCPSNEYRKSLAAYYLCNPPKEVNERGKALFAASKDQKNDPEVKELIKKRSDINSAHKVYK
jgi:hypothetical protein